MGIGHSIVSELNVDSLKFNHPTPATIVQPMTGGDALWYVVYRFLMLIYMFGTTLHVVLWAKSVTLDPLSALHFANWGYIITLFQAILMAYCALGNYYSAYKRATDAPKQKERHRRSSSKSQRRKRKVTFSVSLPKMPKIYIVLWVIHYITLYCATNTFIMYRAGLFRGRLFNVTPESLRPTSIQVILHQIVFGYCLVDFCVCGIPVRLLHFYVMTAFAAGYQLILLIVTITFSRKIENYHPLYDVADFQAQRMTICSIYFVGFAFITPVAVHIVYYGLYLLKCYLVELYFRTTRGISEPKKPVVDATSTSEEKEVEEVSDWAPGGLRSAKIMPISEQEEAEISSLNREQNPSKNSIALVDFK